MVSVLQRRVTPPISASVALNVPVPIAKPPTTPAVSLPKDQVQLTPASSANQIKLTPLSAHDIQKLTQEQSPRGFAQVLSQSPELTQSLNALPQGQHLTQLLSQASHTPLNSSQIKAIQQFLVDQGANLSYRGHATGVDGQYGRRTHSALQNLMMRHATPQTNPSETFHNLFQNQTRPLGDFTRFLKQHPQVSQNLNPELVGLLKNPPNYLTIKNIQTHLVAQGHDISYQGHATGIDGSYGTLTYQALKSAFAQAMTTQTPAQPQAPVSDAPPAVPQPDEPVQKPVTPAQPLPPANGPLPRYDRMFQDGILDMTVAIGYDEGNAYYSPANLAEERKIEESLKERGYVQDNAKALALLKEAGHELKADYTALYVKENVAQADGKPVHGIVRLIKAGHTEGTGAQKRQAAIEGMNQSDVFMYGGHARYGNGPDFDRNFKVTVDWTGVEGAPAQGKVSYDDYNDLKKVMVKNDNQYQAIADFKQLQAQGKVSFDRSNAGNIRMATDNLHKAEFGSYLMNESLKGTENTLAQEIKGDQYRLWLFNGCRTHDYLPSIRAQAAQNNAFNTQNLDLFMTKQTLYWSNISNSLTAFMDGVEAQEGTTDLIDRLRQANPEHANAPTHSRQGFDDNPIRR